MNYFKKAAICILFLLMLSLIACGVEDKADIAITNQSDTQETEQLPELEENGYTLQYREFMNLKTDGTFTFSNGAADYGIGKMTFSSTEYSISNLVYSQSEYDSNNNLTVQYFVNNEPCSEDEFNDAINSQEQKTDVNWYDLSDENISVAFDIS